MNNRKKFFERVFSQAVVVAAISFIAGVGAILFVPNGAIIAGFGVAAAWTLAWGVSGRWDKAVIGVTSVALFFVGTHAGVVAVAGAEDTPFQGRVISGQGVVTDDVSVGAFAQRVPIKILACEGVAGCAGEHIAILTNRFRLFFFGDTVVFSCAPKRVENFSEAFDFRMYLATKGIRAACEDRDMRVVAGSKTVWGVLGTVRRTLEERVNRFVDEPMAALGNGLLFGGSNRMSDALSADFAKTSMTHITAVSGYNIAIVATYLFSFAIFCGWWRRGATVMACVGIFVFVLLVGSPLSGVRAGVMGGIVLFAMMFGRTNASLRALLYAATIMVAINPLIVRYDTGFQLSFLATLGIVVFSPWYERVRPHGSVTRAFADIVYATIAAQLLVVPVLLATFGSFSFVSFATNVLVLWTLPWAMVLVFCTALLGSIFDFLGFVTGVLAQSVLWYDIRVIRFFATVRSGTVSVERADVWWLIGWYAAVMGSAWWLRVRESRQMRALCRKGSSHDLT